MYSMNHKVSLEHVKSIFLSLNPHLPSLQAKSLLKVKNKQLIVLWSHLMHGKKLTITCPEGSLKNPLKICLKT